LVGTDTSIKGRGVKLVFSLKIVYSYIMCKRKIQIYIMFKIITYFIITLFARLCGRGGVLVTFGKHLITSFNNWAHTTS